MHVTELFVTLTPSSTFGLPAFRSQTIFVKYNSTSNEQVLQKSS